MRRREIEEQLRREADEFPVPDVMERVKASAAVPVRQTAAADRRAGRRRSFRIKAAAVCACLALVLAIALPVALAQREQDKIIDVNPEKPDGPDQPDGPDVPSDGLLSTAQEIYAMGAVTTVSLLSSEFSSGTAALSSAKASAGAVVSLRALTVQAADAAREGAQRFHEYFLMLEGMMGDDLVTTRAERNTDTEYSEYEIKLIVSGIDLSGTTVTHIMYYTETLVKEEFDDGETEREYSLEGVMLSDGIAYTLYGERTEESEQDEEENELFLRAYPNADDRRSYVQMERETSAETGERETEYVYTVVKEGRVVEETSVEFESETKNGKTYIEYELEFLGGTGEEIYRISHEEGKAAMTVSYRIGGDRGTFTVEKQTDGSYLYTFSDGTTQTFPRIS